jgi:hypothetical protein
MRVECNTCGGQYDTEQADGLPYFHVCPGIPALLVQNADGSTEYVPPADAGDRPVIGERIFPRDNARDERPIVDPKTGEARPRAEGAGVSELLTAAPALSPALTKQGAKG